MQRAGMRRHPPGAGQGREGHAPLAEFSPTLPTTGHISTLRRSNWLRALHNRPPAATHVSSMDAVQSLTGRAARGREQRGRDYARPSIKSK